MRDILIVFGIVLILLILLSSFGGSITTKKEYYVNVTNPTFGITQEESQYVYIPPAVPSVSGMGTNTNMNMRVTQEYRMPIQKIENFIEPFDSSSTFSSC